MSRKERRRRENVAKLCEMLFNRTAMPYSILFYAEEIAEETLADKIVLNGMVIYSIENKPEYIRNRRTVLRILRRRSELKPHKIVLRGKNWKLKTVK